jgi:NADPH-dependent 2,4-dienoyl-CoA reductase/sulfur reductase-like enzyme
MAKAAVADGDAGRRLSDIRYGINHNVVGRAYTIALGDRERVPDQSTPLGGLRWNSWKRTCVVGAGFAGIAPARHLHKAGLEVVVLEARGRTGGRTRTTCLDDGTQIDARDQRRRAA